MNRLKFKILIISLFIVSVIFIFGINEAKAGSCDWCNGNGYDVGICVASFETGVCDYYWTASQWCMGTAPFREICCCYNISCTPDTCTSLGKSCGSWSDNCGGTLNCGTCSGSTACDYGICASNQKPSWYCNNGTCGYSCTYDASCVVCTPATCTSLGKSCGSWSDNCGETLDCGDCSGKSTECNYGTCGFYEKPTWSCSSGQCIYNCNYSDQCNACFPSGYNADWTITRDCVIQGREGLGTGNLMVDSNVTVQINSGAILVFNPNYKISFDDFSYLFISVTGKILRDVF